MNTSEPLVSIVVVAHDNWPDLEATILSALHQSHPNVEVLVIDQESTDATSVEVPRRFGDRLRYIRQPNRLDGGGYNRGIAEAQGAFIQLLDGDDLLTPGKIETQVRTFEAHPSSEIVYGEVRCFQSRAGSANWLDWDTRDQEDMLMELLDPSGDGAGLIPGAALFRREVLARVGLWDEQIRSADLDYWLRCASLGCRFRHSPGALYLYRLRPGQMSADTAAMTRRTERTLEKALGYITAEPYRTTLVRRLAPLQLAEVVHGDLPARVKRDRLRALQADGAIPTTAYLMVRALIEVPGLGAVVRSERLGRVRRAIARRLGLWVGEAPSAPRSP